MHILTAAQVRDARPGDKLSDGGGLRLDVDRNGNAAWVLRFTSPVTGKERYMGLGPLQDVTLTRARGAAQDARDLLRKKIDPLEDRKTRRIEAKVEVLRSITFKTYARQFVGGREAGWKNKKHKQQWENTLTTYVYPRIGGLPVADIDTASILTVLRPIWNEKKETARRIRGRIEMILSAAKAEGLRTGENPALWRGHLDQVLAIRNKKREVRHHPALPYDDMPTFWKSLAGDSSKSARMLRWIILTACRYAEAAHMDESEVVGDLWTIPAARMKAGVAHTVPLTSATLECLPFDPVSDTALAKCIARHTNKPATTHGFRSTFRDWAGDCTNFPRDLVELALAHQIADESEAAYRRSTALAKRRELMQAWSVAIG